jgi:hypothetical protein
MKSGKQTHAQSVKALMNTVDKIRKLKLEF